MCQRLYSRKIFWNFVVLGKVIRKRGKFMVVDPSEGDRRVAVICLTLIISNTRLTSPSDNLLRGCFVVGGVSPSS
jgi:hypothetical protein